MGKKNKQDFRRTGEGVGLGVWEGKGRTPRRENTGEQQVVRIYRITTLYLNCKIVDV